jgi:hypothetical protein
MVIGTSNSVFKCNLEYEVDVGSVAKISINPVYFVSTSNEIGPSFPFPETLVDMLASYRLVLSISSPPITCHIFL